MTYIVNFFLGRRTGGTWSKSFVFNAFLFATDWKGRTSGRAITSLYAKYLMVAVVVAQLIARLLPISEDPGSNPVIGNF